MRTLKYELWWKRQSIKRWWSNKSQGDRWFIYMNLLFILMTCGVPLISMLLGIELK